MAFFNWDSWFRTLTTRRPGRTLRKKKPAYYRLNLETLEDRTLLAVLPAAVVTNPTSLGAGISPQMAYDVVNPLKIVEVSSTTAAVSGQFSIDRGLTWTGFAMPANGADPNAVPAVPATLYAQATNPSVAFARDQKVYITYVEHDAANASGQLVVQVFDFSGAAPVQTVTDKVLERWVGNDPVLNPIVAVDNNVASFTDTTGANQKDSMVGKAVYVAWNTNNTAPSTNPATANFNPNVIKVVASADGGVNFTTPQFANAGGNTSLTGARFADPQIVFTQGSASGNVLGGQLVFVWNNFAANQNQINLDTSRPDLGVVATKVAGSYTSPNGSTGAITEAAAHLDSVTLTAGGGNNYSAPQTLTIPGGILAAGGTAATITVTSVSSTPGPVTGAVLANPGSYVVLPGNTFTDPGGATFTLNWGGIVNRVADTPGVTAPFTTVVNIPDAGFIVNDLDVTLSLKHPKVNQLSVALTSPASAGSVTVSLVLNRTDGNNRTVDINGAAPAVAQPRGAAAGANFGEINGNLVGTVFDDGAARAINDVAGAVPYISHFKPDPGSANALSVFNGLTSALANGTWTLTVTDFKNDGTLSPNPDPTLVQSVDAWSLHFTSYINTAGFGTDRIVNGVTLRVTGAATAPYAALVAPTNPAAGTAGIGPGISVAVDNTLGSFSPYEGRLYIAYTSGNVGVTTNTNVFLVTADSLSTGAAPTFNAPVKINDDVVTDNFSEGNRPQFMPTIAVDQVTGTLVVDYYDARYDPSMSRVATTLVSSIDGGATFSPVAYLNSARTAIDEITGKTVFVEPIPGNQTVAGALGFGDRQGLVAYGGHVIPIFSSNVNAAGTALLTDTVTIAAGPRIVDGDMGPITATSTFLGLGYNDTFAVDGTQQFSGFEVIFDRPVLISSFGVNQVTIMYHDTVTPAASAGVLIPNTEYTVSAIDAGGPFGTLPAIRANLLATTFLIQMLPGLERSAVGTYSYAIGSLVGAPTINDSIKTSNSAGVVQSSGNKMDQNQDTFTGEGPVSFVNSVTIDPNNLGLGFAVGNLLQVQGGTFIQRAVLQVTAVDPAGEVTAVKVYTPGIYTILPASFQLLDTGAFPTTFFQAGFNLTFTATPGDIFAVPTPTDGPPFQLPYDTTTLPLIVPGPQAISTSVDFNPKATFSSDNLVLNSTNNGIDVTFDRDIQASSFTAANIVRIDGPVGPITSYILGPKVTFSGGGGSGAAGIATIVGGAVTGVVMTAPGSGYNSAPLVVFSGGGGSLANGTAVVVGGAITGVTITNGGIGYTTTPAQAISDGATLNVPMAISDSLQVNNLSVGVNITHAKASDLTLTLIAPDGTQVPLFPSGGSGANLAGTIFDDNVPTSISSVSGPYTGTFRPLPGASSATIVSGGAGYVVGDVLNVQGGTFSTRAQLKVTSVLAGAITGVAVINVGAYTVLPTNPAAVTDFTTPAATGATFKLIPGSLSALNGKNFLGTWTLRIKDNVVNGIAGTFNGWTLNPISVTADPQVINSASLSIVTPGSGYTSGDILTVVGGTTALPAQLQVTGVNGTGGITSISLFQSGLYSLAPTTPASVTGGTGTLATFNFSTILDGLANRTFRVSIPTQTVSGTYSVVIGQDTFGNAIKDTALNSATISPGGTTGNSVGDVLQLNTDFNTPAFFQVTSVDGSGTITGVELVDPGTYTYSTVPASPAFAVDITSGGSAFLNLVFGNRVDTNLNAGVPVLFGGVLTGGALKPTAYPSGNINTTLPAGQTVDVPMNVPDSYLVEGVTVQLSILHQNDPDLAATLIAPDGTSVILFSGVGTSGSTPHANFTNTKFDDAATTPIQLATTSAGIGIGAGPFNPQLPLSVLKGHGSLGTWTLRITSSSSTLIGTLVNWTLTLKSSVAGLGEAVADQFTAPFRIFTQDPTNGVSQQSWTAVGPASQSSGAFSGRIGGLAVDPSDPSGNTVYTAGASGGVWKTTNFLTTAAIGPTWYALTDLGPGNSLNTGSIAIFGRNNDPNQSIVFVATGEGDTGSSGVGFLRSMDGGKTWRVLDSFTNVDVAGNILPISSAARLHQFFGQTAFKVIVDPNPTPTGQVIVYAAMSGGVYRSNDTGGHWTLIQGGGVASDVVLSAGSAGATGNLQILYAAIENRGIYFTSNAPAAAALVLRAGGAGNAIRRNMDPAGGDVAITINNPNVNPLTGNSGRILLAAPALTGNPLQDTLYEGWVYVVANTGAGAFGGLYVTKDFGLNWTKIRLPVSGTVANPISTNNDSIVKDFSVDGSAQFPQANYDVSMAVDPNNASIVYIGGTADAAPVLNGQYGGFIRVDTSAIVDPYNTTAYDNSNNSAGQIQFNSQGAITFGASPPKSAATGLTLGAGQVYGMINPDDFSTYVTPLSPYLNMLRDPESPFLTPASLQYTNITAFGNSGEDARYGSFTGGGLTGTDQHELVVFKDPLTGKTRVIFGDDQGISTGTDDGTGNPTGNVGSAVSVVGSRNGNIQITQLYDGATQPSVLAADIAGALFYGVAQDDGFPVSSSDLLDTGVIGWSGGDGDGAGVKADQTGSGTAYYYKWPCCGGSQPLATDFFTVIPGGGVEVSRTTGLIQNGDIPAFPASGQWPYLGGSKFAVNPIDGTSIAMSSSLGRVFLTSGPSLGTGVQWFPIADPTDLDSSYAPAIAFGAPADANAGTSDFIYVGTSSGASHIYVTFTGGGVGTPWTNISKGLSGGAVQFIVTNPNRGSHEAFAVTSGGVFWMPDSSLYVAGNAATWWQPISGNIFSATLTRTLFNDPAQALATLKALTALQADYRYAIPDAAGAVAIAPSPNGATEFGNVVTITTAAPHGFTVGQTIQISGVGVGYDGTYVIASVPSATTFTYTSNTAGLTDTGGGNATTTHPVLYAGGVGGIYRSFDKGTTWTYFPDVTVDGALQEGGLFPSASSLGVTDLALSLGNINPLNGTPSEPYGRNMLVATTYGSGMWAIRLNDQVTVPAGNSLYTYAVNPVDGPHVSNIIGDAPFGAVNGMFVTFSGPVDPATFTTAKVNRVTDPFGNPVPVTQIIDLGAVNHNQYEIIFETPQTAYGFYKVNLGPAISDYAGYQMDQNQNFVNGETPGDIYNGRWLFQPFTNNAPVITGATTTVPAVDEDQTDTRQALAVTGIPAGGSGYKVGDFLSVVGGTGVAAQLQVVSVNALGAVTSVTIPLGGAGAYITAPTNPVSVTDITTPAATGATFNLTFSVVITGIDVNTFVTAMAPASISDPDHATYVGNVPSTTEPVGIAVTGVDNTNGDWQYSLDGGATWTDFGTLGIFDTFPTAARLLEANSNGIPSTDRIRFLPNADFSTPFGPQPSFTFRAWDLTSGLNPVDGTDGGVADTSSPNNGGTTAFSTGIATATITVHFVNDEPSFTKGADQFKNEDDPAVTVPGWATNVSPDRATPPDANEAAQNVDFIVTNDYNALFAVLPFITPAGALKYTLAANANGMATVTVYIHDDGGTAFGGINQSVLPQTFTITVAAVNDPPVNSVPPALQTTAEDTALVFNVANGNLISISDVDDLDPVPSAASGDEPAQVTLIATHGAITLSTLVGLNFAFSDANGTSAGDGTADATMTFRGTISDINTALKGMSYLPTLNYNGAATLTITTNDLGNFGTGVALTDTDVVNINITQVNDPPVNSVPGIQTTAEETAKVFSAANGNRISISDVDDLDPVPSATIGDEPVQVTLTATNGVLTLSGIVGLDFAFVTDANGAHAGTGTADTTMTFRGTIAAINTALNGMSFLPNLNFNGAASVTITTNDLGNYGTGGAMTDTDSVTVNVTQVNDPPVNSVPATTQTTAEDTALVFNAANSNLISISDVDDADSVPSSTIGDEPVQVTLTATHGTLTLSGITGLSFSFSDANGTGAGTGTANATMTFRGTIAVINTALSGLSYLSALNYNGAATITITTNDRGNFGTGGTKTDTDVVNVTITQVNDAPVNSVPAAQTTPEDTALVFSVANSNRISISDVDDADTVPSATIGDEPAQVTLTATNGVLTLSGIAGLNFIFADGNGTGSGVGSGTASATMTFRGTIGAINTALNGLSYLPNLNYNGAATVTILTNDLGNFGTGGALTDSDTVNITVTQVNDAPVNSVPAATQTTAEETALVFNAANSNLISISDVDDADSVPSSTIGDESVQVTLTATHGTLTLSGIAGLDFAFVTDANGAHAGTGTGDTTMTFRGKIADINTALSGLSYLPSLNYNGAATVTITTNDLGNFGTGGAKTDTDVVNVTVTQVNDAPVNSVPAATQTTAEETALIFKAANSNLISISDVDDGDSVPSSTIGDEPVQVTLTATHGVLTLSGIAGLSFSFTDGNGTGAGDGTADATMTFRGTIGAINTALNGLIYSPAFNYNGPATVTITTNDLGNFGAGGPLTDTDVVNINVTQVNDAPVNSVPPATQMTAEETTLFFNAGNSNLISISDVDDGDSVPSATIGDEPVQVTLTATHGTLTLSGIAGLDFAFVTDANGAPAGDGTADATMTFRGTIGAINTALNGLSYLPTLDYNGAATITITTNDLGNFGTGGAKTDSDVVNVTITQVNDAPVNTVPPATQTTAEETTLVFNVGNSNRISIGDVDDGDSVPSATIGDEPVQVTLTATHGVLTLSGIAGLSFSFTDGNGTGAGDGTADATMTFRGTIGAINTALNNLSYLPALNYNGPATVTITTNDLGNFGAGGPLTDTDVVNINVTQVNDAPVNSVPLVIQNTATGLPLVFNTANSNLLSISDVDDGDSVPSSAIGDESVQVTLTATHGTLTLSGVTGLDFAFVTDANGAAAGDGTADITMTFRGTIADINTALDGLTYLPTAAYNGPATVTITTNDLGNFGTGGAKTDTDVVNVTVAPINDPPVRTAPATLSNVTVLENSGFTSLGLGTLAYSPGDADDAGQSLTYTVTAVPLATLGKIYLSDNATVVTTTTYTLAQLQGMKFKPIAEATGGPAIFSWNVKDDGGVAYGGVDTLSESLTISVTPVNDAPVRTAPATLPTLTVFEDSGLALLGLGSLAYAPGDADDAGQTLTYTVTALPTTLGTVFLNNGITAVVAGNTYTLAELQGMKFMPTADTSGGPATFSWKVQDSGLTANGGVDFLNESLAINVTFVNDQPTFVAANPPTAFINTGAHSVPGWAAFNPGPGANESGQTVVAYTVTGVSNTSLFTVTGQPVVAANGTLAYTLAPGVSGTSNFTVTVKDNGTTNNGGIDTSAPQNFTITVSKNLSVVAVTASAASVIVGQSVTFTATVTASNTATLPTDGVVTFYYDVQDVPHKLTGAASHVGNVFKLTTTGVPLSTHTIYAVFTSSATFTNGVGTLNHATANFTVANATTKTALTSSPAAAAWATDKPTTFTATVNFTGGTGDLRPNSLIFKDTVTNLTYPGTLSAASTATNAIYTKTITLSAGAHTFVALYAGSGSNIAPSVSNTLQNTNVRKYSTLTLTSPTANPTVAASVTYTATFLGLGGVPIVGRIITFTINGHTYTAVTNSSGKASVTSSNFFSAAGTYTITASITGDSIFNNATATLLSNIGAKITGRLV